MAKTRGGKKRVYKQVGRKSASKCYQDYCRSQHRQGLVATSGGRFGPLSNLSDKIQLSYQGLFRQLGT